MRRLEVISRFFLALASTSVLLIGGVAIPPAGVVLIPLVPQPVLAFGFRFGIGWGIGVLLAALVLLLAVAGKELALIYGILAFMTVLLFGLLGRLRSIELLVSGIAGTIFILTCGVLFYFYGSWSALVQDLHRSLDENLMAALRVHAKMGFPQDSLDLLKERIPQVVQTTLQFLPGLLFVGLALTVLVNIVFLCRRFPARRAQWLSAENFREWKAPEPLVWGLIACGFVIFIPGLQFLRIFAFNILLVIGAAYFIQGLAVIAYFFHKNNVPRFLRGVTYVLIAFEQIFTLLVVGLGLFDLWGDFRRLGKNNLNPSQAS
jgi:uncharacterized protein YybS (DUF2232 family)